MSLVTRTVTSNLLPSAHILLKQVGAPHAHNTTPAFVGDLDEAGLAAILRQPVAEISRRRLRPRPEAGFVDSFGAAVRADEIVFRIRRFSPSGLRLSPHVRALWSLKTIPCCTETWEYLKDSCVCGAIQRWQIADRLERCDICNASLAEVPAELVDPCLRAGLGFLIGLLDPDDERRTEARLQLPRGLASWDGGMIFELSLAVLPLTAEGYTLKRGKQPTAANVKRYATSLAQAADIIRRWPEGLIDALTEGVKARSASKRSYKGIHDYLAGLQSQLFPPIVKEAIAAALSPIKAAVGQTPDDQICMREAALLTGQAEGLLATARRADQLRTRICIRDNKLFPTLDRAEMQFVHQFVSSRLGPDMASHRLGLPQYAIEQLAQEGLLKVNQHPYLLARYGKYQVVRSEIDRLRNALQSAGALPELIVDPVPLHRVARAMGGGPKPWGKILKDLLEGRIPYFIEGGSVNRIWISAKDAAVLQALNLHKSMFWFQPRRMSQRDAVELLNLPLKHAHLLSEPGAVRGDGVSWRRLRHLARKRVTLTELIARTGRHGTKLEHMLEADGCYRCDSFGWVRSEALAAIANYQR